MESRLNEHRRTVVRWGLVALVVLLAGCGAGRRPDIILLVVDTLRADRLG